MSFLPLSLPIPAMLSPPFTAVLSLPSLSPLRRSKVVFTRSRRPPGVVCCSPWDFSFDFYVIEPPCLAEVLPMFETMPKPLPPRMPVDSPLQHTPATPAEEAVLEEQLEEYYYEGGHGDPDDYFFKDLGPLW